MKRILPLLLVLFLTGCGKSDQQMDRALALRHSLESSTGYSFSCSVTADYGDQLYSFGMDCVVNPAKSLSFTVTAPESIAGITGTVSSDGGKLTFDDTALAFDLLADDQLSPVSAPWILVKALQGGFLSSCGEEDGRLRISLYDSYREDAAYLEIWLDAQDHPQVCEIFWDDRRILSLSITNFTFL